MLIDVDAALDTTTIMMDGLLAGVTESSGRNRFLVNLSTPKFSQTEITCFGSSENEKWKSLVALDGIDLFF